MTATRHVPMTAARHVPVPASRAGEAHLPHPTWLAVGRTVMARRIARGIGRIDGEWAETVARHTATQVVMASGARYRRDWGGTYRRMAEPLAYYYRTRLLDPTEDQ